MDKVIRILRPSVFAVVILCITSGYALFIPPLVGLANNGDFERIMITNNLVHEKERDSNDYFGYFNHKYDRLKYYNELEGTIKSTHSIFIHLAMVLDDLFFKDDKFDIRFIAILSLMVLALGIYWMVEVVERMVDKKWLKYFLAVVAVIIFGDIGYTSYFNSFFGEAIAYPFFLLSIAALLKFASDEKLRNIYIFVFFISSFMFIGSKNQFSLNGILSFAILVVLSFIKIPRTKKIMSGIFGVSLVVSTVLMYLVIDDNIYLINKYHMMTRGVMLFEPDVQEVTKELNIDERFALLAETIYYDNTPVIDPNDEILKTDFYSQYDVFRVTLYYLKNPKAFSKMMKFGWKNSFTIRPEILGNFERNTGRIYGEKSYFFSLWSSFKENYIPHSSNFGCFFLVICVALAINHVIQYKNHGASQVTYFKEIIMFYVFLTGFSQLLISFIGAGDADLKKHLFMTTVSLDILFYYYFAYAISLLFKIKDA